MAYVYRATPRNEYLQIIKIEKYNRRVIAAMLRPTHGKLHADCKWMLLINSMNFGKRFISDTIIYKESCYTEAELLA